MGEAHAVVHLRDVEPGLVETAAVCRVEDGNPGVVDGLGGQAVADVEQQRERILRRLRGGGQGGEAKEKGENVVFHVRQKSG